MRLQELSDWPRVVASVSSAAVLKAAKASKLKHFVILELEDRGVEHVKLIEVGVDRIDQVLALLQNHTGRLLRDIQNTDVSE